MATANVVESDDASDISIADDEPIMLKVKLLDERVFHVDATTSMPVTDFRERVAELTRIPTESQRLIYRGKLMKDGTLLSSYSVQNEHTIHLVSRPPPPPGSSTPTQSNDSTSDRPMFTHIPGTANPSAESDDSPFNFSSLQEPAQATETEESTDQSAQQLEAIQQGLLTLQTMLSTSTSSEDNASYRDFHVGQWVDALDTVDQWLEATVMQVSRTQIFIHYHHWPTRWDEWIHRNSDRIAAFRTHTRSHNPRVATTVHHPAAIQASSPYASIDNTVRNATDGTTPSFQNTLRDVRDAIQEILPRLNEVVDRDSSVDTPEVEDEDLTMSTTSITQSNTTDTSLLAPLLDRLGRALIDSAHGLDRETNGVRPRRSSSSTVYDHDEEDTSDRSAGFRSLLDMSSFSRNNNDNGNHRSIDVHIHAIVAPSSLSNFASRFRDGRSSTSDEGTSVAARSREDRYSRTGLRDSSLRAGREEATSRTPLLRPRPASPHPNGRYEPFTFQNEASAPLDSPRTPRERSDSESEASDRSRFMRSVLGALDQSNESDRPAEQETTVVSDQSFSTFPELDTMRTRAPSEERRNPTFLEVMRRTLSGSMRSLGFGADDQERTDRNEEDLMEELQMTGDSYHAEDISGSSSGEDLESID